MTTQEMWEEYLKVSKLKDCGYEAWSFGGNADELANLVLIGRKRGTSSAYDLYAAEGEPLPKAGQYSVVLYSDGRAACVIKTVGVDVKKFCEVTQQFAAAEGEGDRSLAYWRRVHQRFFTEELKAAGLKFTPEMKVVCELFEVVYPL